LPVNGNQMPRAPDIASVTRLSLDVRQRHQEPPRMPPLPARPAVTVQWEAQHGIVRAHQPDATAPVVALGHQALMGCQRCEVCIWIIPGTDSGTEPKSHLGLMLLVTRRLVGKHAPHRARRDLCRVGYP
jgi:hypothetical protein